MIIVLAGPSGSGKTSSCGIAVRLAREAGVRVAGMLCEAVFSGGSKVGIDWRDLADEGAARRSLARRLPGFSQARSAGAPSQGRSPAFDDSNPHTVRFGSWEFDRKALAEADAATAAAVSGGSGPIGAAPSLVIVDEIGPLELERGSGMVKTLVALDEAASPEWERAGDAERLGLTVVVARPDIADKLAARWPGSVRLDVSDVPFERTARRILEAL